MSEELINQYKREHPNKLVDVLVYEEFSSAIECLTQVNKTHTIDRKKLLQIIDEASVSFGAKTTSASVSMGTAEIDARNHNVDELIHEADRDLYQYKNAKE